MPLTKDKSRVVVCTPSISLHDPISYLNNSNRTACVESFINRSPSPGKMARVILVVRTVVFDA